MPLNYSYHTMFHVIGEGEVLGELMVDLLKSNGYQAAAFSNSVEYYNHVCNEEYVSPIAIITDARMAELSGDDFNKICEKFPEMRFMIISGYNEDVESSINNVCHYLTKPFNSDEMMIIVGAIVREFQHNFPSTK